MRAHPLVLIVGQGPVDIMAPLKRSWISYGVTSFNTTEPDLLVTSPIRDTSGRAPQAIMLYVNSSIQCLNNQSR